MRFLELEKGDVAVILKADGTCEASVPVNRQEVADNLFLGAAVMYTLQNETLCHSMQEAFYTAVLSSA